MFSEVSNGRIHPCWFPPFSHLSSRVLAVIDQQSASETGGKLQGLSFVAREQFSCGRSAISDQRSAGQPASLVQTSVVTQRGVADLWRGLVDRAPRRRLRCRFYGTVGFLPGELKLDE